jgi:EAL domain-containing protein (putative c-di-GMP-specific phosphodiesterase class I)
VLDIVELIVTIAHKMKFQTIAEGIETTKQLEQLRDLRCELGQGYLFSQPLEANAAEQILRDQILAGGTNAMGAGGISGGKR